MCYEYWRSEKMHSGEEEARKRAQELIEKAKATKPAPKTSEPVESEKQKETVPA